MSFLTVYEVKHISRDPGKSREMTFEFPLFQEMEFPGKWEILNTMDLLAFINAFIQCNNEVVTTIQRLLHTVFHLNAFP
jgi:hypothetical protein